MVVQHALVKVCGDGLAMLLENGCGGLHQLHLLRGECGGISLGDREEGEGTAACKG